MAKALPNRPGPMIVTVRLDLRLLGIYACGCFEAKRSDFGFTRPLLASIVSLLTQIWTRESDPLLAKLKATSGRATLLPSPSIIDCAPKIREAPFDPPLLASKSFARVVLDVWWYFTIPLKV